MVGSGSLSTVVARAGGAIDPLILLGQTCSISDAGSSWRPTGGTAMVEAELGGFVLPFTVDIGVTNVSHSSGVVFIPKLLRCEAVPEELG